MVPKLLTFDRRSVESDLHNLGCDPASALAISTAVAEIMHEARELRYGTVISYEADDYRVLVDVIHYGNYQFSSYPIAKAMVKKFHILVNYPRNGYTVRMVEDKHKPVLGDIV